MEEKNMALSAELIGLRGGLSLISKYTDEIKKCQNNDLLANYETRIKEQDFQRKEEKYTKAKREVASQKALCESLKKEYKKIVSLPANVISSTCVKRPITPEYSDDSAQKWGWICGLCFGVLIFLIMLDPPMYYAAIPAVWSIPISNYILFRPIIHLVRCIKHKRELAIYKENVLLQKNKEIQVAEAVLEKSIAVQNAANAERINAEIELKKQKENEAHTNQKNKDMIYVLAAKSHAVNESLRETYGIVIMECDWQNIDLILHYLETGRADTLKEALQQVDMQRQTNQITFAINNASAAISSHIESAFSRMGEALAVCFNKLNQNIQNISIKLENQIAASQRITTEANNALLDRLDKQISATEMQNILLEKANKSSDELLNDLRYNQQFWRK